MMLGWGNRISIHALREEGDHPQCPVRCGSAVFLSTPSARRATREQIPLWMPARISIHALREEGDCGAAGWQPLHGISIHALREEGDKVGSTVCPVHFISIHALREEGDPSGDRAYALRESISIHALREEGDLAVALPST